MDTQSKASYIQSNKVAYDKDLREYLKELHWVLGDQLSTLAQEAVDNGAKYTKDASDYLKLLSKLTSELSISLMKLREGGDLNDQEKADFEAIKALTEELGNLQFKVNKIITKLNTLSTIGMELAESGAELAEDVMNAQEKFRNIRADINDLGFMSKEPDVAQLFNSQKSNSNS